MKRIKFLGTAFVAVLALTGAVSASASAESLPNILPVGTTENPLEGTSTSGLSTFGNGILAVESSKSKGTLSGTSEKLGTFDVLFEKSKDTAGTKCTGLDDTAGSGSILALGEFHVRSYKNSKSELKTAIIFLLKEIHFECGTILVVVKGCVAGSVSPEKTSTKSLTVTLAEGKTAGDNEIVKVENETLTGEENCELKASQEGGEFKLSVEVTTQTLSGFKKGTEEPKVEVMPD